MFSGSTAKDCVRLGLHAQVGLLAALLGIDPGSADAATGRVRGLAAMTASTVTGVTVFAELLRVARAHGGEGVRIEACLPRFYADGSIASRLSDGAPGQVSSSGWLEAVARLPLEHRAVYLARDGMGLSVAEVITATGHDEARCRALLHESRLAMCALIWPGRPAASDAYLG